MAEFKVNNVLQDAIGKIIYNRNRKEQADNGSVTILNTRSTRYEPYTRCLVNNEQYLIEADNYTEYKDGLFEHQVSLIENMAIATTIYPVDRSFKRVPSLDLDNILAIYQRELEFYQGFRFDYDDTDTIYSTKIVDKEYAGVDLAVILYDLFRSINAIPRFTWQDDEWYLTYEFYDENGDEITLNVEGRKSKVNDIDYATNLLAKTRNVVSEDEGYIYWPSATTFMTPRSKGTMYKTSDLQYEVDSDVMAIYEVVAEVKAIIYVGGNQHAVNVEVDITNMVKEAEVYESLSLSTDNNPNTEVYFTGEPSGTISYYKQNCIRYTKESNVIDSLWFKRDGIGFTSNVTALFNAIRFNLATALYEQYSSTYDLSDSWTMGINAIDVEDIPIRVKYRPRRDIDFVTEKNSVLGFNKATILNNQKDSAIEIGRFLQNSNVIVNRIGNEMLYLTQSFDTYAEAWKLGDYYFVGNKRWLITDITYSESKNLVICDAEFTVNFSNVNRETAITRQPSPYVYTGKGVQSNFIYKEYLIFDETLPNYPDNSFLNDDAKRTIMNLLDYSATYDTPLRHMLFRKYGDTQVIDKQLFGAGSGNVILLHAAFKDARIAGKAFKKLDGSWYEDPVWYVNPTSEILSIATIKLNDTHSLITDTDTYKYYPIVNDISGTKTKNLFLRFDKDPNDQLAITFEILTLSESNNIIVGNAFTRFNNLIRILSSVSLDVYSDTEPYTIFDRPKGTLTTGYITLTDDTITVLGPGYAALRYWCIAYEGEIVLAGNNYVSEIKYRFTRNRSYGENIYETALKLNLEFVEEDYMILDIDYLENEAYIVEPLEFIDSDNVTATLSSFEYEKLTLQLVFNDSDIINAQLIYKDLEKLVMGLAFRDSDIINAQLSGFEKEQLNLDLEFNDNDRIDAIVMLYEDEDLSLQLAFHENDRINASLDYKYQTTAPTLNYISWVQDGAFYEYTFQATNEDDFTAEIFTGITDEPTYSRGMIPSQGSVNFTYPSMSGSLTVYAKAKATDKILSEAVSRTGSIL
ncbi:MAG: hypothetical protein WC383_13075 [Gammaproteobacteria bacterium]